MNYDREQLLANLTEWDARMSAFSLPAWKDLPDIELYMDQVITFLTQLLGPYLHDKPMTASTINNYVRTGVMPPPKKKRYARLHLAFLVMICTLRQSMSIADIASILPLSSSTQEFKIFYENYVQKYDEATRLFVTHLRPQIASPQEGTRSEMSWLVASSALQCALSKMLTEHLLSIQNSMPEDGETLPSVSL